MSNLVSRICMLEYNNERKIQIENKEVNLILMGYRPWVRNTIWDCIMSH